MIHTFMRYAELVLWMFSAIVFIIAGDQIQYGPYAGTFTAQLMCTLMVFIGSCCLVLGWYIFAVQPAYRVKRVRRP